jgi:hypothetical protein
MRCADLGPTPGRQRNAAISSSSDEGVFILKTGVLGPAAGAFPR